MPFSDGRPGWLALAMALAMALVLAIFPSSSSSSRRSNKKPAIHPFRITLCAIAAMAVADSLSLCPTSPARILVAGGGRHNSALMQELRQRCPVPVAPVESAGLNGDMLEAQAFAHLAVRVQRGLPTSASGTTGVSAAVGGGTISYP